MLPPLLLDAARSLRRHIGFTALNVVGLAVGLACAILIGLWVEDELSYDDFHPKADRTYRVLNTFDMPELQATISAAPAPLGPTLAANYSQVEHAVRIQSVEQTVRAGDRTYVESDVLFTDASFFDVFGFSLQRGTNRLGEPGTVLLTPAMVDKYFPGASDPIGQRIQVDGAEMEVTGIVEPAPANTHLDYTMIVSLSTQSTRDDWGFNNWTTYVTLRAGTTEDAFEATALQEVSRSRLSTTSADAGEELAQTFHLQPVTGIHLNEGAPRLENGAGTGSATYVALFAALAVFVLLLACINFMNLSTARSSERANEVGVRKSMGAGRPQLAGQFLGEALIMTAAGLVLALGICALVLPAFGDLAGKSFSVAALVSPLHLGMYAGLLVVVGVAAGGYPAFVLSGYEPVDTMRGTSMSSKGSSHLRQALVVFQFALSIALIAGTAIVHQQVSYLQSTGLGFSDDNVLVVNQVRGMAGPLQSREDVSRLQRRLDSFTREVEQLPGVRRAALGYSVPGSFFVNSMFPLDASDAEPRNMNYSFVGTDYVETLDLKLAAGRDFSRDFPTDTAAVMLNEAAAREYGLSPQEAVGESIRRGNMSLEIVGVLEDFHYESLHNEIYPMIFFHTSVRAPQYAILRVEEGQEAAAVASVRQTWGEFSDLPFTYSFLANDLAAQYEAEVQLEHLFVVFAGLAILIACLGLFGLAAYSARQRTKEIGLRKALGATARSVITLISADFLKLVGIAFLLAAPTAYLAMQPWLASFAYRIDIGVSVFAFAGALAFLVAAATVSTQAWRAARVDPTTALRAE